MITFFIFSADGLSTNSFGLFAPDGTGVGYFSFANETEGYKYGQHIIDTGSAYDGIYCDNASVITSLGVPEKGWWYIAHDSFKGYIEVCNPDFYYKLISPNGGETWEAGSIEEIIWDTWGEICIKSSNNVDYDFEIEFSSNGGKNWTLIADNVDRYSEAYSWKVPNIESTECLIRLNGEYGSTSEDFFTIMKKTIVENNSPKFFAISQNTPNPFNPSTNITFTIPEAGNVTVEAFNTTGQKVDSIANEFMTAGTNSVTWNASEYPAGVYFCMVKSGKYSDTIKMTLVK